jgi:hypothetical protein
VVVTSTAILVESVAGVVSCVFGSCVLLCARELVTAYTILLVVIRRGKSGSKVRRTGVFTVRSKRTNFVVWIIICIFVASST